MKRKTWKHVSVLLVVLTGTVMALPSFFPVDPALLISLEDASALDGIAPIDNLDQPGRRSPDPGRGRGSLAAAVSAALADSRIMPLELEPDADTVRVRFSSSEAQRRAADALLAALDGAVVSFDLAPRLPNWVLALGLEPIRLGLDLRGGVHFIYEVVFDAVAAPLLEAYLADVRAALRDARIRASADVRDGAIVVTPAHNEDLDAARKALSGIEDPFGTGTRAVIDERSADGQPVLALQIPPEVLEERRQLAMEQNMATLRNRIDVLGVTEPVVQQQGADRIIVQVPGVQNPAQLDRVLGSTATLEWRLVDLGNDAASAARTGRAPQGAILRFKRDGTPVLLQRQVIASGEHLTSATSGYEEGRPAVFIRLGGNGASRMLDATQANLGRPLAVLKIEETRVPDKRVESGFRTERREEAIFVGRIDGVFSTSFRLSGGFTPTETQELAMVLRSGALAAPLFKVYSGTVSASLGQDNVERGRLALITGLVAVVVFMAAYYRGFGLIANLALLANLLLIVGVLALMRAALTLPGIAGIVLTLGMAVDANVLIIERIREELRKGTSARAAIMHGYDKAWSSIADANITTLIAAIVLLGIGTGPIKNFAVTLSLGVLTSMFTAMAGTRTVVELWYGKRKVERLSVGGGF